MVGDEVVDLTDPAVGLPGDMVALLALGGDARDALAAGARPPGPGGCPWDEARLMAPVPRPPSFLAIARNYDAHIGELGHERPEFQTWFSKQPTCVIGPGAAIEVPRVSVVGGLRGRAGHGHRPPVPARAGRSGPRGGGRLHRGQRRERAGLAVADPTMMMGKGFDTHGPTGPWIVTADEVGDPAGPGRPHLGERRAPPGRHHADMIFTCAQMIEHLSAAFTLEAGMLITTGTPAGVAAGEDPPRGWWPATRSPCDVEGVGS